MNYELRMIKTCSLIKSSTSECCNTNIAIYEKLRAFVSLKMSDRGDTKYDKVHFASEIKWGSVPYLINNIDTKFPY